MNRKLRIIAVAFVAVLSCAALSYTTIAQTDTRKGNEPASIKALNASSDNQLKIFELKNADAEQHSSTIRPLFCPRPDSTTTIVYDKRTNTVIARGPEAELSILEVVLLRLDEPVASK